MRLLVVSDVHGRWSALEQALEQQPSARHVFCLGDGIEQYEEAQLLYPERQFYLVAGNCDGGAGRRVPLLGEVVLGGVRVVYLHGHIEQVKFGYERAVAVARQREAQLLLYGHTHQQLSTYEDGLHILNPGSLGYHHEYGLVDITPDGHVVTMGVQL